MLIVHSVRNISFILFIYFGQNAGVLIKFCDRGEGNQYKVSQHKRQKPQKC